MTLERALLGKEMPEEIRRSLALVEVRHVDFVDGEQIGYLVAHEELTEDLRALFGKLLELKFKIEKIIPICAYDWDDEVSMADNNTSSFNYRLIAGTNKISNHAYGRAIDINPMQNPYVHADGRMLPSCARYDLSRSGTITPEVVAIFKSYGFSWGGDWSDRKDYQHFEKTGAS